VHAKRKLKNLSPLRQFLTSIHFLIILCSTPFTENGYTTKSSATQTISVCLTFTDDNSIRITRLNPIDTTYYTASGEDGACVGFDFLNYGGSGHLTTFEKVGDTIIFSSDNWASCMPNGVGKEYWLAN